MDNILSLTIKKGYDYITNKNDLTNITIQILEPLSIIIKLGSPGKSKAGTGFGSIQYFIAFCPVSFIRSHQNLHDKDQLKLPAITSWLIVFLHFSLKLYLQQLSHLHHKTLFL